MLEAGGSGKEQSVLHVLWLLTHLLWATCKDTNGKKSIGVKKMFSLSSNDCPGS